MKIRIQSILSRSAVLVPALLLNQLLSPVALFAGDAGEWFDRAVRVATPIGLSASLLGFIVIGIAHSSMAAAEWAQRHERGAVKGAIYCIGATGLVNLVKSIVS